MDVGPESEQRQYREGDEQADDRWAWSSLSHLMNHVRQPAFVNDCQPGDALTTGGTVPTVSENDRDESPVSDENILVERKDVRPAPARTRYEMRNFTLRDPRAVTRSTWLTLALLTACSIGIALIDHIAAGWFSPGGNDSVPLAVIVISMVLVTVLFLRTDPPGGTGGLVGDREESTWLRRSAGPLHWGVAALLVVLALIA